MSTVALSGHLQDYLRTIYCLEKEAGGVSPSRVAGSLGVSLPSVTSMMRKLASRRLVSYTPYRPISLTRAGERQAREVVRHHRLLETYLQKALGFSLEAVHQEADKLEHAMSEELEDRIDTFLGHPSFDPHGSPIPDSNGQVRERSLVALSTLRAGEQGVIEQVTCRGAGQLRHLEATGLVPGVAVRVRTAEYGSGIVMVQRASVPDEPIGETIASCIMVSRTGGTP